MKNLAAILLTLSLLMPLASILPAAAVEVGQSVTLESHQGIGIVVVNGEIVIFPASLHLLMTVRSISLDGIAFSIERGTVTVDGRTWLVPSGKAFLSSQGRLVIDAVAFQEETRTRFQLLLGGPARFGRDQVFARLQGALFNETTKIGLGFLVGLAPGDANMDGRVDIVDASLIAITFDTGEGRSGWNPDYDLDLDGRITILDAAEVAINYDSVY